MKTVVSLGKHHYLRRAGVSLIVIALMIALIMGSSCGTGQLSEYNLTMAVDPAAGGTATDETNRSPYTEGAIVNIRADANAGYEFVNWTAPVGTFGYANAAVTIFAMPGVNVTVTAHFVRVYNLSMAANPAGGGMAIDLFNDSPYAAGTVVSIQAVAAAGYQFTNWTVSAGEFGDANAEKTTFTMPTQSAIVTANFELLPNHFTCYWVDSETYIGENVTLEDQFGAVNATVEWAMAFGNPAEKLHGENVTPISYPDHHLTVYTIDYEGEPGTWFVVVENQFGTQHLTVTGPVGLAVPTWKLYPGEHEPPVGLDHFLVYQVINGSSVEEVVSLNDEFGPQPDVLVGFPVLFANPVRKTHGENVTEIMKPDVHAVIYSIYSNYSENGVQVLNQFGEQTLNVSGPDYLVVPSEKTRVLTEPDLEALVLGDYDSQLTNLLLDNNIWAEQRDWEDISDIGEYDVVVINEPDDPGETTFLDFLDGASNNSVGVVFTSSYSVSYPWGISLLESYLGDPGGQAHDWESGDVYYNVTQAHAIFDGWSVGDEITIITGGDCDHAWFWDYSGNTIAEVGSEYDGIEGDAVAVGTYGGSTHVLLGSLGPQWYTDMTAWTDDAKTIFINAVLFAGA